MIKKNDFGNKTLKICQIATELFKQSSHIPVRLISAPEMYPVSLIDLSIMFVHIL